MLQLSSPNDVHFNLWLFRLVSSECDVSNANLVFVTHFLYGMRNIILIFCFVTLTMNKPMELPQKKYCISKVSESNTRQEYPQLPKLMKLFLEAPRNLQFHTEHQSLLMAEVLVAGKMTAGTLWCSSQRCALKALSTDL